MTGSGSKHPTWDQLWRRLQWATSVWRGTGLPGRLLVVSAQLLMPQHPGSSLWGSMQLFMWQPDIVGVAHFVMDCFDLLWAAPDARDDGSSRLRLIFISPDTVIHTFVGRHVSVHNMHYHVHRIWRASCLHPGAKVRFGPITLQRAYSDGGKKWAFVRGNCLVLPVTPDRGVQSTRATARPPTYSVPTQCRCSSSCRDWSQAAARLVGTGEAHGMPTAHKKHRSPSLMPAALPRCWCML